MSDLPYLDCLDCGQPDQAHKAATSTTLEDHHHAAGFYDSCPGDLGVQHRLFPEAFPTPGPYQFMECGLLEAEGEGCWHVSTLDGTCINQGLPFSTEKEAREWAAEDYEGPEG